MIKLSYKLTESEIYTSLVAIFKSRFITNLMRNVGFVILAVMLFLTTSGLRNGTLNFTAGFAFPIFLAIYLIFLPEITSKFQTPNLVKKKNPFSEEVNVKIYETGYRVQGQTFNNQQSWNNLNAIIETKDFFLLKETDIIATVIPKRVLSAEDSSQLVAIINQVEGPKKLLLAKA